MHGCKIVGKKALKRKKRGKIQQQKTSNYVEHCPSVLSVNLPSFAAEHASSRYAAPAPAAVDRYLLSAEHSVANLAAAVDRWDGQTDGHGHPTVT